MSNTRFPCKAIGIPTEASLMRIPSTDNEKWSDLFLSITHFQYICFVDRCLSFCTLFLLAIAVSVLLRFSDSEYTFGIFKLVLEHIYLYILSVYQSACSKNIYEFDDLYAFKTCIEVFIIFILSILKTYSSLQCNNRFTRLSNSAEI